MVTRLLFLACILSITCISSLHASEAKEIRIEFAGLQQVKAGQLQKAAFNELERFASNHRESDLFDASYSMKQYMRNKGYYFSTVAYAYVPNKQNPSKVVFHIAEGKPVTIDKIASTGADAWEQWSDDDITHTLGSPIKGVLKHIGVGHLLFRSSDVSSAINSIATSYLLHGYQRVQVGPEKLKWNEDKTKVSIYIPVVEGPQFTFSELQIETDHSGSNISARNLRHSHKDTSLTGSPFHPRLLREEIGLIRRHLNNLGYLAAIVDGSYTYNKDEKNTVSAKIKIKPGPQFLFSELIISGDPYTRRGIFDYYTRRLNPGKSIDYSRIEQSIGYLYRIGVFESIRWKKVVRSTNNNGTVNADILLEVKELPKRSLALTLGYGSYEEFRTGVTYSNRNLFGIGLDGEIGYNVSVKSQRLDSSLFIGEYYRKSFLILQTSWEEREEPSFDSDVFDMQLRYRQLHGKEDIFEGLVGYNFEQSEATNVAPGAAVESEGSIIVSSIEWAETLELRDNLFNPTDGIRLRGNVEWSSEELGSDVEFLRYEGSIQYYIPFGEAPSWVLASNLRLNTYHLLGDTKTLPIQKRLFLGGENSVRSFKRHELGPTNNDGDPLGGLSSALATIEARFPLLPSYNLSGAIFWDAGMVSSEENDFDAEIGQGIGIGIRFDLPIGPIRLDIAKNIGEEFASNDDPVFHFSLGFSF